MKGEKGYPGKPGLNVGMLTFMFHVWCKEVLNMQGVPGRKGVPGQPGVDGMKGAPGNDVCMH